MSMTRQAEPAVATPPAPGPGKATDGRIGGALAIWADAGWYLRGRVRRWPGRIASPALKPLISDISAGVVSNRLEMLNRVSPAATT